MCSHLDSLVALSRFVKCEKCNHFFVVMSDERKSFNSPSQLPNVVVGSGERANQQQQQANAKNQQNTAPVKHTPPPPPKKIFEYLNKFIVGQEHAKKVISVAVYNHYKRLYNNLNKSVVNNAQGVATAADPTTTQSQQKQGEFTLSDINFLNNLHFFSSSERMNQLKQMQQMQAQIDEKQTQQQQNLQRSSILYNDKHELKLDKSNILMLGPTGSGKTLLAQTVAKCLDVPFAICDCTTLTQAGYVGEDVESVIAKLLQDANYNVEKCQQGRIIFHFV
jgi:ATP-dependent Clp protease ATP-binding subunit ClpX